MQRVPTINDLRLKLCYICREEELYDRPPNPPRRWVHPCKCTLIAHEQCLLEWIRASERNPDKSTSSILKCPQCGSRYDLDSDNPLHLRIMDNLNAILTLLGSGASVVSIGSVVISLGAGVYFLLTGYGAFAMHQFLGEEMYEMILSDDPANWPFHAFINLPIIPLSLILSNTTRFRDSIPLLPLMMLWPSVSPISRPGHGLFSILNAFKSNSQLQIRGPGTVRDFELDTVRDIFFSWPPSPMMVGLGFPIIKSYYNIYIRRLRRFILGNEDVPLGDEATRRGALRQIFGDNWRMEMLIEDEQGEAAQAPGQLERRAAPVPAEDGAGPVQDDNNVNLVLDGRFDGDPEAPVDQQEDEPRQDGALIAPPAVANQIQPANQNQNRNENENDPDRWQNEVRFRLSLSFLGRLIGGALLIPSISSLMGSVLFRLALQSGTKPYLKEGYGSFFTYHPRHLLYRFLAIRPLGSAPIYPPTRIYHNVLEQGSSWEGTRAVVATTIRMLFVGTPAWVGADPVWWRNTVGLGMWTLVKDCVVLWYEYISQREIRSRILRDRSFAGIDLDELDLKPGVKEELLQTRPHV